MKVCGDCVTCLQNKPCDRTEDYNKGVQAHKAHVKEILESLHTGEFFEVRWAQLVEMLNLKTDTILTPLQKLEMLETREQRRDYIESLRTPAGGFTRKTIESLGKTWPPLNGWRRELELGIVNSEKPTC